MSQVWPAILRSARWKNLLMIWGTTIFFTCTLAHLADKAFDVMEMLVYATALTILAAAGNWLNDIVDVENDRLNGRDRNPVGRELPLGLMWTLYATSSFLALFVPWMFFEVFDLRFQLLLITLVLLFLYSFLFQRWPLVGNLVVAILCAFPVLMAMSVIQDIDELMNMFQVSHGWHQVETASMVGLGYAFFAFQLTMMREQVKDIEDRRGDELAGYFSLPVLIGLRRSRQSLVIQSLLLLLTECLLLFLVYELMPGHTILCLMILGLVILPMAMIVRQIYMIRDEQEARKASHLLKWAMLLGISTALYFWFL